ncbi:Hypothetical predicted protein [Cloeon dipterum]|uniref:Uncharacterized protein n=1 Tax=Cloeon dipterum TaxID=197152 RepID=A0A8S1BTW2_9INSE|nr:Hypothetical predicted protein [Cloeon dipterum]
MCGRPTVPSVAAEFPSRTLLLLLRRPWRLSPSLQPALLSIPERGESGAVGRAPPSLAEAELRTQCRRSCG